MSAWRVISAVLLWGALQPGAIACEAVDDSSRIAVAGGSLTEILYFLRAEDRIVAVDITSTFPTEASEFPSVGYVRALSAEGLLSLNPTLVLGESDMGPPEVLAQVRRTGVDTVVVPEVHTAAGIVEKVRCVAAVLNMGEQGKQLIESELGPKLAALDELRTGAAERPSVALLLQISAGAPIGAGRDTSAHGLLQMAQADNAFADFEGWKPVAPESMASSDPDYVVMTERGFRDAGGLDAVLANPALMVTSAAGSDNRNQLIVMDGMAMLGFGPRTLEAALQLGSRLHSISPKGPQGP